MNQSLASDSKLMSNQLKRKGKKKKRKGISRGGEAAEYREISLRLFDSLIIHHQSLLLKTT